MAERFEARSAAGRVVVIEQLATQALEDGMGGLHWDGGGARYRLASGEPVERLGESVFQLAITGETFRREEGHDGGHGGQLPG
ncbi:hypothetical protein ACDW_38730 [Acidovorax sp. DW039]|uniref:hypothetical protein n=1 Tax=Acidovorax sp. DW039 TaxID=3095606 RepID=UPI0030894127|nr:hypothetical protein ACDW_38730 [Acidovorax sp. DW039]